MSQLEKSSSGVTVGLTQSELMVRQFSIRYSGTTLAQPRSSATVECWGGLDFDQVLLPPDDFLYIQWTDNILFSGNFLTSCQAEMIRIVKKAFIVARQYRPSLLRLYFNGPDSRQKKLSKIIR